MLDEAAETLPEGIFDKLNGGVNLLPEVRRSGSDIAGLYTLGEYRRDALGRYIVIFAGSILETYPDCSRGEMREVLLGVLRHELTHHLESLAGDRSLELEDERQMNEYRRSKCD